MAAKFEIDEKVSIVGKVVSSTTDETGTIYQVKFSSQDKQVTQYFEEDELVEITGP